VTRGTLSEGRNGRLMDNVERAMHRILAATVGLLAALALAACSSVQPTSRADIATPHASGLASQPPTAEPALPAASPWLLGVNQAMDDGGEAAGYAADHLGVAYSALSAGIAMFAHPAGNHPEVIVVHMETIPSSVAAAAWIRADPACGGTATTGPIGFPCRHIPACAIQRPVPTGVRRNLRLPHVRCHPGRRRLRRERPWRSDAGAVPAGE
jgi:hypothetical protein